MLDWTDADRYIEAVNWANDFRRNTYWDNMHIDGKGKINLTDMCNAEDTFAPGCAAIEVFKFEEDEMTEKELVNKINEAEAVNQIIEARFAAMEPALPKMFLSWEEEQVLLNALFHHKNDRADGPDQRIARDLFDWITSIQNTNGSIVITVEGK